MKNFSLKALGALIFAAGLVVAGVVAPANATVSAGWNGATPSFATGSSPAMSIDFTPTNASATYRQIAISIRDSSGTTVPMGVSTNSLSPGTLSGCNLASLSGAHVAPQLQYCEVLNAPYDYVRYPIADTATPTLNGTAYGAFNISLTQGLFNITQSGSYTVFIATYDDFTLIESATLPFTIAGAPSVSASPSTIIGTVGTQLTQPITYTASNFSGPYSYSAGSMPQGLSLDAQNGSISGTPATSGASTSVAVTVTGANNATVNVTLVFNISPSVNNNNNNNVNNPTAVSFSGTGTLRDANSNPITNFPSASPIPAFTISASNFTNNATYKRVGVIFSEVVTPPATINYFTVANPQNISSQVATYVAWSPGNATCGVTAISLGGVAQTGSSGITCAKETWTFGSNTGFAVRLVFPSETSASLSVSVADNVFTSTAAGNYRARLSMASDTVNNSYFSGSANVDITVGGVSTPAQTAPTAALSMSASSGQLVAGSVVGVSASGLQSTAAYTVTVQSTPQTIGSGNAVNGSVSTNVTLPSGLEAGWHTLTFTSTAADGSAVVSKYYFKISASGTLLSTSSTIPAELANTGVDSTSSMLLMAGGLSLALIGAEMFIIARRKRSN